MIIDEIIVQCIEQSDLIGKDTLIFKINGVRIFNVEISSNETKLAKGTDVWVLDVDTLFIVELNNTLIPNKILESHKITAEDIGNREITLEIKDDCHYLINAKM